MTCRSKRRLAWAVIVVASVYLVGWADAEYRRTEDMAKTRATIASLRKDAETAIAAKNWTAADTACAALQKRTGGAVHAHALRGQMFQLEGKISEAKEEYRAAYALGDVTAGGSLAYLNKRGN